MANFHYHCLKSLYKNLKRSIYSRISQYWEKNIYITLKRNSFLKPINNLRNSTGKKSTKYLTKDIVNTDSFVFSFPEKDFQRVENM